MHTINATQYGIKNNKESGFTLIELMIAMVISLTLIFACTTLYSSLKATTKLSQELSLAQESLRTTFYLFSRSVRQAESVTVDNSTAGKHIVTVSYGIIPASNVVYNCLGAVAATGSSDIYEIVADNLVCNNEIIALGVDFLSAVAPTATVKVMPLTLKIKGMPDSYRNSGVTFNIALRQAALIKLYE